jgi:hypothetical protein
MDVCRARVRDVLHKLLFSAERGALCSGEKVCGNNSGGDMTYLVHHKKKRALCTLDATSCSHIVERVVDEVATIVASVQKPLHKNNCVTLGALYLMQHGKAFGSFSITRSPFLHAHLPSITDLPRFGFERSAVRVGKNIIISRARLSAKNV